MNRTPPKLDRRTLSDLFVQLLAKADDAFQKLAKEKRWKYAQKFDDEAGKKLLSPPFDDAGLMLCFAYARLLELVLARLNRVPEKNEFAFLCAMGVAPLPPTPARVPLTFSLLPGGEPTRVPRGTQAGSVPAGSWPAVLFETDDDLTVVPAKIVQAFALDPMWDRYTDQSNSVAGGSSFGFTPFLGSKRMPHVLYIGNDALLDISGPATVELRAIAAKFTPDARALLNRLAWGFPSTGTFISVTPASVSADSVVLEIPSSIDSEPVSGVGLKQALSSHWLRAALMDPLPDAMPGTPVEVAPFSLEVSGTGRQPELAFFGNAALDTTKSFLPFGEAPKIGDTFSIACREAFSKPGATVTLDFDLNLPASPVFAWEVSFAGDSERIPDGLMSRVDETAGFTRKGAVVLPLDKIFDAGLLRKLHEAQTRRLLRASSSGSGQIEKRTALPVEAFRLRIRVIGGIFRETPRISSFKMVTSTALVKEILGTSGKITVLDADLIAENAALKVGDQLVIVREASKNTAAVVPPLKGPLPAGTIVECMGFSLPLGVLSSAPVENTLKVTMGVGTIGKESFLFLDDPTQPELVEVVAVREASDDAVARGPFTTLVIQAKREIGPHLPGVMVRLVTPFQFLARSSGQNVELSNPFLPFGNTPSVGDTFDLITLNGVPPRLKFEVDVESNAPSVGLGWQFLGKDGWRAFKDVNDATRGLLADGTITLQLPDDMACVLAELNGKKQYWIRAVAPGQVYGLPTEYELIDPDDPSTGFRLKAGTGNLTPPIVSSVAISYAATGSPLVVAQNGFWFADLTSAGKKPSSICPIVSIKSLAVPYADLEPALYVAFDAIFPEQPVRLFVAVDPQRFSGRVVKSEGGKAGSSERAPLQWEYSNGTGWGHLAVLDGTHDLTSSGALSFLTPSDFAQLARFDLTPLYWIRARSASNDPLDAQPLLGIYLNSISATQGITVTDEVIGSGTGLPRQAFRLIRTPVLPGPQIFVIEPEAPAGAERMAIEAEEGADAIQHEVNPISGENEIRVRWHQVNNFHGSGLHSRHYTLDHVSGQVEFGDRERGLTPLRGSNNIKASYRAGGAAADNVAASFVSQVKSPVPGIGSVKNPIAADGGADAEPGAEMLHRGPQVLRHRGCAVSSSDLEWLAREASGTRVARSKCLPNVNRELRFEPGWATLLILPQAMGPRPSPTSELIREVEDYLHRHAFAGLALDSPRHINVIGPGYVRVSVSVKFVPADLDETQLVKQRMLAALAGFFHPLTGGPDGLGWEFARKVYESEVYQLLERLPGMSCVKELELAPDLFQRRIVLLLEGKELAPVADGDLLRSADGRKSVQAAEAVSFPSGRATGAVRVKGFREGDRITRVCDVVAAADVPAGETRIPVTDRSGKSFTDSMGFPRGSKVLTFDARERSSLNAGLLRRQSYTEIVLAQPFSRPLQQGELLSVFYPFSMNITSVSPGPGKGSVTLGIEDYEAEVEFLPGETVLATLDNSIRFPLAEPLLPGRPVTSLRLLEFTSNDVLVWHGTGESFTVFDSLPVSDIVYLDDNFLPYSGTHQIVPVAE